MIIPISYPLNADSPLYPGTPPIKINPEKSIAKGDSANTSVISTSSHAGTHVDVPRHFCESGFSVRDVFQRVNSYSPVSVLIFPLQGRNQIRPEDLDEKLPGKEDAIVLLIRTEPVNCGIQIPGLMQLHIPGYIPGSLLSSAAGVRTFA